MQPNVYNRESLQFSGLTVILAGGVSFLLGVLAAGWLAPAPPRIVTDLTTNPSIRSTVSDLQNVEAIRQRFRSPASRDARPLGVSGPPEPQGLAGSPRDDERIAETLRQGKIAFLAQVAAQRRTNYYSMLTEWGLQTQQVESVLKGLEDLHRGAMVAGDATLDLLQARLKYKKEMKNLLGDARFSEYEAFERGKPYRREIDTIKEFAGQKWPAASPQIETVLARLLEKHGMSTTESWDGPYDPAPRPQAGRPAMLAINTEYASRLTAGLAPLLEESSTELPEHVTTALAAYYQSRLAELQEEHRVLSMTDEEHRRYVEERIRKIRENQASH